MEIKEFIEKFAEAVDVENVDGLTPETQFRDLDEWSSLASLSLIAMYDEEYGKSINGNDIRGSQTINDLFKLAQ